ncbi:VIN3-LIKE PROTEIN 2-RELATED, partial [Salix purpurea]
MKMLDKKRLTEGQIIEESITDNGSDTPVQTAMECMPFASNSEASLPITPCKLEMHKDGQGRNGRFKSSNKAVVNGSEKGEEPQDGSTSKKRNGAKARRGVYGKWATEQEVRVVKTFVDTFIEDPASLAEQIMDTFSECISSRRSSVVPSG